jgi:hypothetical protein
MLKWISSLTSFFFSFVVFFGGLAPYRIKISYLRLFGYQHVFFGNWRIGDWAIVLLPYFVYGLYSLIGGSSNFFKLESNNSQNRKSTFPQPQVYIAQWDRPAIYIYICGTNGPPRSHLFFQNNIYTQTHEDLHIQWLIFFKKKLLFKKK